MRSVCSLVLALAALTVTGCRTAAPEPSNQVGAYERCVAATPGIVTHADLLEDIVDLDRLAAPDATSYVHRLASSTNPASDPANAATWYGDDAGVVRIENGEKVVLESFVPGAIVRFWTANPNGRFRVYVDGSAAPAIDVDMTAMVLGVGPFPAPFAYQSARGYNLVHPIAWAHSVKVTTTSASLYFTLDYREYDPGVVVESYPPTPSDALACATTRASEALSQGAEDAIPNVAFQLDTASAEATATVKASGTGGALRLLRLRPDTLDRAALSTTALVVDADGVRTLELPLAALLAPMNDAATVEALPLSSAADGLTIRLPMPFASHLEVSLESRGGPRVTAALELALGPMDVSDDSYRLFASWTEPRVVDASMWPGQAQLASLEGKGRFVGLVYEVGNADPGSAWWGEGDPIVTVDGRAPMRGTGTEDHFLFAFCSTERFHSPFSGQTRANASDSGGIITLYRFHTSDDIPFASSFVFDFELLTWGTHNGGSALDPMSSVVFFYARPSVGGRSVDGSATTYAPITLPPGYVRPGPGFVTCG